MIERVKCTECDNLILPQTAEDNDGLCAPCAKTSRESRAEISKFQKQLADGSYYRLSEAELHSASVPKIFQNGHDWKLQPEYYSDENGGAQGDTPLCENDGENFGTMPRFAFCPCELSGPVESTGSDFHREKHIGTHHFWQNRLNGDTGRSFTTTGLMVATSPNAVGGGRMEPLASFGRGLPMLLGSRPKSHPLPELAALAPTSPSFAGRGGTSWPNSLAADRLALSTPSLLRTGARGPRSLCVLFAGLCAAKTTRYSAPPRLISILISSSRVSTDCFSTKAVCPPLV